ncbi:MAG TPA: helix-turn-helix domain-containing protein [Actinomycetes bacterium]|nr:helix-turn-helix domain-containing protein [Actinomycetes bacterium]
MSSGVGDPERVASLRAMAHPLRLRMLSMLTGTAMSAAELARELDLTHANASYHLRQMLDAGLVVLAEEESVRGGKAKRYRYDVDAPGATAQGAEDAAAYYQAIAGELVRRSVLRRDGVRSTSSDAELWVAPEAWDDTVQRVADAVSDLHRAARPPHEDGTVHVSVTTALFRMEDDR